MKKSVHNSISSSTAQHKGNTTLSAQLDLETFVKAAQALSSEIELDRLLEKLLQLMLENGTAQKGCIVLEKAGDWVLEVVDADAAAQVVEQQGVTIAASTEVPQSLIYDVARTGELQVIADALREPTLQADPYIQAHQPRSVLCLPMRHKGQTIGVIYLENNSATDAFTPNRVQVLTLLASHAEIALQNAQLYQQSQESQRQMSTVLSSMPGMAYSCLNDKIWTMHYVSDGCLDLTGYLPDDLLHSKTITYAELIHPDDEAMVATAIESALQAHQPFRLTYRIRTRDNQEKWVWEQGQALRDEQGDILVLEGFIADISDRRAAEVALTESEAYHRNLFEQSSIGLLLCDMSGQLLYANPAYAQILGRPREELASLSYWDITPEKYADAEQHQLQSLQTTGRYGPYEKEYIHKNGRLIPVRLSGVIVERYGKQYIWSNVEDISDLKQAESALKTSEAQLREQAQTLEQALQELQSTQMQMIQSEKMSALGNLVAGVAHEINNPVGFLKGNIKPAQTYVSDLLGLIDLFLEKMPKLDEEIEEEIETVDLDFVRKDLPELLESMNAGVDRIKNISTSLRTFSRADKDHKTEFNLHEGIDSTILILKHRLKATDQRPAIKVVKEYGNLPTVICFPGQLNQVFMNILANAIDVFDEAAQQTTFAELKQHPQIITITTVQLENNVLEIRIGDNGKGMSAEVKAKIFDHLYTTKGVGKGTGLGLAIARQIVEEKHGGNITVESHPGHGTEFILTLPINNYTKVQ